MVVTLATDDEFRAYYGTEPPAVWLGVAHRQDDDIVGFGGVFWTDDGQAMGFFDRKVPVSAFIIHRVARRVLRALKQAGEPAVYVVCDRQFAKAEQWLNRLGFSPMNDNPDVWQVKL